jgi:ribosomal protein S16
MPLITLNYKIRVERIGSDSRNFFKFVASDEERQNLATRFQFLDVLSLSAELTICKSARDCWDVVGQLSGGVVQACSLTGAPISERVDFLIEERYVGSVSSQEEVEVHMDEAEPLENEAINIGEMLAQSLAIAVTPWPRALEAPETYTSGEELPDHPFAGLAALKRQPPK